MSKGNASEEMFSKFDLGSEYLRASDMLIDGHFKPFTLTIAEFFPVGSLTAADGKTVNKPVISFVEAKKIMVLNSTSQEVLHMITGQSDGHKTVGHKITIEVRVVDAFGDKCLGIRIMPPPGTLIRKGIKKFLGTRAVWESASNPKE